MKILKILFTLLIATTLNCFAPVNNLTIKEKRTLNKELLIADAIKHIESGGNYNSFGSSGENGAYQFMPKTWRKWCMQTHGVILKMTPINQDSVAIRKIRSWTGKYTHKEIASIWNSGGYKWQGKIGVNKYGVKYNVPEYVRKVSLEYNSLKNKEKYWKIKYISINKLEK